MPFFLALQPITGYERAYPVNSNGVVLNRKNRPWPTELRMILSEP